jgi:hypothetical protein
MTIPERGKGYLGDNLDGLQVIENPHVPKYQSWEVYW